MIEPIRIEKIEENISLGNKIFIDHSGNKYKITYSHKISRNKKSYLIEKFNKENNLEFIGRKIGKNEIDVMNSIGDFIC